MPKASPRAETAFVGPRKGHCSFGEACAFKHDPNKKGKSKGRPRSPFPTASPHRNSNGDGKGSDDGSVKGTPTLTGKSPSGNANRLLCTSFTKETAIGEIHVIIGMFPTAQNSKLQVGCRIGDKCACKHTAKPADEKNVQHRLQFTFFHRMMNDRRNYGKFSRMRRPE